MYIKVWCFFVFIALKRYSKSGPSVTPDPSLLEPHGFLRKRVFNQCHPSVAKLFPFMGPCPPYHNKQIDDHMYECVRRPGMYWRSIFGLAAKYNRLPQEIVDLPSVSAFQKALTRIARHSCALGVPSWPFRFHT